VTEEVKAHETETAMVQAALAKEESSAPFSFVVKPHATSIAVWDVPSPIALGDEFKLKVRVSCSSACDLRGKMVKIIAQDAVVKEIELVSFDGTVNETDEFVVKAPIELGGYTWTAAFPAQETEGVLHEESSTPFLFIVKPHTTSIEVWDVPSPIALGDEFRIQVGVKCSAECKLTDKKIEIYDHEGAKVATGTLGDVPWSAATALSCAEVELKAPSLEGRYRWTAKFPKPDLELPHEGATCTFAFGAARQPGYVVTIEVIDKGTKTPIKNAQVLLRPHTYRGSAYRSRTDDGGVARVSVPEGDYQLYASGDDKDTLLPTVKVASDVTIKAELLVREREWWEY